VTVPLTVVPASSAVVSEWLTTFELSTAFAAGSEPATEPGARSACWSEAARLTVNGGFPGP
jgi:hypothetical protein